MTAPDEDVRRLLEQVDAEWAERKSAYLASFDGSHLDGVAKEHGIDMDRAMRNTYAYQRLELAHQMARLKAEMMASLPLVGRLWLRGKLRGAR